MHNKIMKWIAIGMTAVLLVQTAHLDNYGYLKEVFASEVTSTSESAIQEDADSALADTEENITSEETSAEIETATETDLLEENNLEQQSEEIAVIDMELPEYEVPDSSNWPELRTNNGEINGNANLGTYQLVEDVVVKGNLGITGALCLNGHSLTVEGNLMLGGVLIVDGNMEVSGNLEWYNGCLYFEQGSMQIGGDLHVNKKGGGIWAMTDAMDYLLIGGDLVLEQTGCVRPAITAGVVELKGDFLQKKMAYYGGITQPAVEFVMQGTSILLLSGTDTQNIYLATEESSIQNISVSTEGLEQDEAGQYLFGNHIIGFSGYCNYDTYESNGCPTTYGYVQYADLDLNSLEQEDGTYVLYGSTYITDSEFHLDGKRLSVIGDFIQDGDVYLENGMLFIYGDYRIQSVNEKGKFGPTDGFIDCSQGGYVYQYKDFVTESVTDHTKLLSRGYWYSYGNITQLGEDTKGFASSGSFYLYENTDTNSEQERHIRLENPLGNPVNQIDNRIGKNLVFDNGIYINKMDYLGYYTGYVYMDSENTNSTWVNGDVIFYKDTEIKSYLYIRGNALAEGELSIWYRLSVDGELTVTADIQFMESASIYADTLTMKSGALSIGKGTVNVGDIIFEDGGDATLVMEEEYRYLYCDNFYYGSSAVSDRLTAGTIQVSQDFYVKDTGTPGRFVCSGTHTVDMDGSNTLQLVTIEDPASNIEKLNIRTSGDGMTRITEGTVIHTINYGTCAYMWEGIEGSTLETDMIYNEDLVVTRGTLDLNGHTLTVNGDFYAEKCSILLNGGALIVNGDFNCVYRDWQTGEPEWKQSITDIIMDNEQDRISIAGDWNMNFNSHSLTKMTKGLVTLGGNLNVDGTVGSSYSSSTETIMKGTSLLLDGTKPHQLSGVSGAVLEVLDLTVAEGSSVTSRIPIQVDGKLDLTEAESYEFTGLTLYDLDNLVGRSFKGNLDTKITNGLTGDIKIIGTLTLGGWTVLNGHTLRAEVLNVNGNTTLSGGSIYADTLNMVAKINMTQPEDYMEVTDMNVNIKFTDTGCMTDGNILVRGDFRVNTDYKFQPTGNHTITFNRAGASEENKTEIYFANKYSKLNRVVLANLFKYYKLNRELEEIAVTVEIGYEDTDAPSVPEKLVRTYASCHVITLKWDDSEDNNEFYRYNIYRNGEYIGSSGVASYVDVGLSVNTTYSYTVTAVDRKGNESQPSAALTASTRADMAAPYLAGKPWIKATDEYVTFDCSNLFEDVDSYVQYYIITRDGAVIDQRLERVSIAYTHPEKGAQFKVIQEGDTVFTDTEVEAYGVYTYGIRAVDMAGNRSEEYRVEVRTNPLPEAPADFDVQTENGYNYIIFTLSGKDDCEYYEVYRRKKGDRNFEFFTRFYNTEVRTICYEDWKSKVGTTFEYYVVPYNCYNMAGEESQHLSIETLAEPQPPEICQIEYSIDGDIINETLKFYVVAKDNGKIDELSAYVVKEGTSNKITIPHGTYYIDGHYTYTQFTLNVEDLQGTYELHMLAKDSSGNPAEETKILHINEQGLPAVTNVKTAVTASTVTLSWDELEGAKDYVVRYAYGDSNTFFDYKTTAGTQMVVSNLRNDSVYRFKIAAYDANGIRGLSTAAIEVMTAEDTTAPTVEGATVNGTVLGSNTALQVQYKDDVGVAFASAGYRVKGASEWTLIGSAQASGSSGTVSIPWNKAGLVSGEYEVFYQVEDESGNLSEQQIYTYILDTEGPEIRNPKVIPGDWKIQVTWDAFTEADYSRFALYRVTDYGGEKLLASNSKDTSYEEIISPKQEYTYILRAYDIYGNVTETAMTGQPIDNDPYPPEVITIPNMFAAANIPFTLSAEGCFDNDEIVSYRWDMGNGDIGYGEEFLYTYLDVGSYGASLTVEDASGNQVRRNFDVAVGKDTGTVHVTVTCGRERIQGAAIAVCINGGDYYSSEGLLTDSLGQLDFNIQEGNHKIAAYAKGYTPKEVTVKVIEGVNKTVIINLEHEDFIQTDFTAQKMTPEQMKDAGIDVDENREVFDYILSLEFNGSKIEEYDPSEGKRHFTSMDDYIYWHVPKKSNSQDKDDGFDVFAKNVSDDPSQPVFVVMRSKRVEISWLSDVYQLDFTVCNHAEEPFSLDNVSIELTLPEKLNMATMNEGVSNDQNWDVGTIKPQESASHTWYVTGTSRGKHSLEAYFKATLQPFGTTIDKKIKPENELEIRGGSGLHLYIYPEKDAYIGEQYYIQFKLKNESEEAYHYVTASFGRFETTGTTNKLITITKSGDDTSISYNSRYTGINYFIPEGDQIDSSRILSGNDRLTVECLNPGEALYGTYKFQFNAAGDINTEYYHLVNKIGEELSNTGMTVTISSVDSHLIKRVKNVKRAKKKPSSKTTWKKPTPVPEPETPSSNKETKDPVNLMTGAFTVSHRLASVGGAAELAFDMAYNSTLTESVGELGRGWHHDYEMYIEKDGALLNVSVNPNQKLTFAESEETEQLVSGHLEDDTVILEDDSHIERIYYQTGTTAKNNRLVRNSTGYTLYYGGEEYHFNTEGTLTGYVDEEGHSIIVRREDTSLTITDAATTKSIRADYDENGRIVKVTDAAGSATTLCYDGERLVGIVSKNGTMLLYDYDEEGHIIKGMEQDGRVYVENTYDKYGRVLTQVANGKTEEITRFSYTDEEDGSTSVVMTNADGTTEKAASDAYGQGLYYENAIGGRTTYEYNENHDMIAYHAPDGTGAAYTYDEQGNIIEVVESTGKTLKYTYDENDRITSMVGNDGTDVKYTYNEKGQPETITSGNGLQISYTYNTFAQILSEKSTLGTLQYTYEDGLLTAIQDYSGNTQSFAYDANGNVIRHTDGTGVVTEYKVDQTGRVAEEAVIMEDGKKATTAYTYDEYGNILTETDALGNTTAYTYDEEDRISVETRPDGSTIQYEYDTNGNITKITLPDGETTAESVYDAAGNALSLIDTLGSMRNASYNAGSQLLSMTESNGGTRTFTYYENGLLESQTDAMGNTIIFAYDEAGRISSTTDAEGNITQYGYDKDGNLSLITDALENTTKYVYNAYRKVVSQTDPNGNVTKYAYDKALNCVSVTDAEGGVTEFAYDARGQITSMTKKGASEKEDVVLSITYDNLGNVVSLTDGEGNTRRMEYDLNSNLTGVYDAKGVRTESYTYDSLGNPVTVTDAFGNVTENTYDSLGNLIKQLNQETGAVNTYSYVGGKYLASSTDAMGSTASQTYDSMGNVETLTNPNGGVTRYQYDLNNNLTDESIGEDYHIRYTYNAQNLAASKTNSRNQQTAYEYDVLGRLVKQEDEAGQITYTYDANGNVLTVTETVGTVVNTITRTYDGLNRVTSYEDAKGNRIGYEYDKTGNLVKLTYPNGKAVTYTYDRNGGIRTMKDWKNRTTTYSYDENGRLVKTERPDGTVETRSYDKAGQLTRILDKCGDTVGNQQEYTYDAAGNITEVKNLVEGRLNFTGVEAATMTYDKNNRLLTYNGEKVEYDKDGNMVYGPLQGKMAEFAFDCRNRLIRAGDTEYEYDAENNRTAVITKTGRTEYVINTQPELSQVLQSMVTDNAGADATEQGKVTYYFYGTGLSAQEDEEGNYLTYHFNNVGSTMAVTDEKGAVKYSYSYSPYGELLEGEYTSTIPFLYNGQYGVATDGNGLYYMRARYYNVDIKRFINQDVLTGTLERISSLNRYAYVEGNPISYLDPFGLAKSIYDEWHEAIGKMQVAYAKASLVTAWMAWLPKPIKDKYMWQNIIVSISLSTLDMGVCIGRAWEGLFENDYDKIDESYQMMGEIIENFVLTVESLILDNALDFKVSGSILNAITWLKEYSEKIERGEK